MAQDNNAILVVLGNSVDKATTTENLFFGIPGITVTVR